MSIRDLETKAGRLVKELRLLRGMSQEELARLSDCSISTVANLENARGTSLETFLKVLRSLDRADDVLEHLDEYYDQPTPMELLRASKRKPMRPQRAPRKHKPS